MQTTLRITNAAIGTFNHSRNRSNRHQPGDKQAEKKKITPSRKHHGVLTERIPPLAPDYCVIIDEDTKETWNLTSPENFDYLYRSAVRYTQLMGLKLPFRKKKGKNNRRKIVELFKIMESLIPEYINLELIDERLHFCIYRFHNWPDQRLFWIPLDFTEKLPYQLKMITLEFLRRFARHHDLQDIKETYYYEMAVQQLEDYEHYDTNLSPKDIKMYKKLASSYQKGKIYRLLKRMKGKSFCPDFEKQIDEYHTEIKKEQELLILIKEGMGLITPDKPCIMQYYYDWAYEESPDFRPAGLDLLIMLTYSINDALNKEMVSYFSCDCQESYAITPVTTLFLTPETDKLFRMDDYPEKLSDWIERFNACIINHF